MRDIFYVVVLVFLFWGHPDIWDKLDHIIDVQYHQGYELDCYTDMECQVKYGGDGYGE